MAETTRLIFDSLKAHYPNTYEISQIGMFHISAVTQPSWPIYPTKTVTRSDGRVDLDITDLHGEKTFEEVLHVFKPDIVFAFDDPQHLTYLGRSATERSYKLVLYMNFDGGPIAPNSFSELIRADRLYTMSHFAKKVYLASHPHLHPTRVGVMYSPADTKRFAPPTVQEKAELRRELLPSWVPEDAFILGWVGRNQWRKQTWVHYELLHHLRIADYAQCGVCNKITILDSDPILGSRVPCKGLHSHRRPGFDFDRCAHCGAAEMTPAKPLENVFLWLHMLRNEPQGAWPTQGLESIYEVQIGKELLYTEGLVLGAAITPDNMPLLYKIWDTLTYLSGGEGFGIPACEAMCCGLPVVYTNYSSHAEYLNEANAGLPVGGTLIPEPLFCTSRIVADMEQAIEATLRLYDNRILRDELGHNGRRYVHRYNVERQAALWHDVFNQLTASTNSP